MGFNVQELEGKQLTFILQSLATVHGGILKVYIIPTYEYTLIENSLIHLCRRSWALLTVREALQAVSDFPTNLGDSRVFLMGIFYSNNEFSEHWLKYNPNNGKYFYRVCVCNKEYKD